MNVSPQTRNATTPKLFLGVCMLTLALVISLLHASSQMSNLGEAIGYALGTWVWGFLFIIPLLLIYTYVTPWGRSAGSAKLFNAVSTIAAGYFLVLWIATPVIKDFAQQEIARSNAKQEAKVPAPVQPRSMSFEDFLEKPDSTVNTLGNTSTTSAAYVASCQACHSTGVAGAPLPGAESLKGLEKDIPDLVQRLRQGFGAHPPVDAALSTTDLVSAIQYMLPR